METLVKTQNNIPDFDHNLVIPPHIGTPTKPSQLSPYACTSLELCEKFSYTNERIEILTGFINFRLRMNELDIKTGFQWLDGSFLEDIESKENRAPRDLDLVTFYRNISLDRQNEIIKTFPEFANPEAAKEKYYMDHYPVDYGYNPDTTVELSRYWVQLFSHNRDQVWKGMLRLELNTPDIDTDALLYLKNL